MAQETAGTIGIPVLKNEVMPYLTDYAKRRERAELYKQKAEQRAAELAAKKAAEDEKFKYDVKPTEGGMLMSQIQQLNKADIDTAQKKFSDPNVSLQQKYELSGNLNRIIDERNAYQKYQEGTIKAQLPEMQKYYQVDESDIPVYSSGFKADPSIFNVNHVAQFKSAIEDDPNRFKWRDVGSSLFKTVGADKYSFTNSAGQQEVIEANNLFVPEQVINPITGRKVTAQKLNADVAMDVAMGNPKVWKAVTTYTKTRMPQLVEDVAVANQAAKLGVDANKYAQYIAQEEALNKLFGNMGGVTYSKSLKTSNRDGSGSKKSTANIKSFSGTRSVEFPTYALSDTSVSKGIQQATIGNADPKKPDQTIGYSKEYNLGANIPVYLMQNPEDIKLGEKNVMNTYLGERPDGLYTLKTGFKYSNPTESSVYFANKDIRFGTTKDGYVVKKGTPLDNETALNLIRQKRGNEVRLERGYEVTANMAVPYEIEEADTQAGFVTKERVRPSVKIFIPEKNAGAIKSQINLELKKANSPEASSAVQEGEFKVFED